MSELIRTALSWLQPVWRQILVVHLIYTGLGFTVFAPLLGALGHVLLNLSGRPALSDMDLLFFALSPAGLLALILFAAVSMVVMAFELASFMAIGVAASNGQSIGTITALGFSFKRARPIFELAARLVVKVLLTIAPFLLVAVAVALFLVTDYDINYYLAVQPPEFWLAAVAIGVIAFLMAVFLIRRLISWSLTLPLILFAANKPSASFAASEALTKNYRRIILRTLVIWVATTMLIGVIVALGLRILTDILLPLFIDSIAMLVLVLGLMAALLLVASVLVTAWTTGGLAMLLAALAHKLAPQFRATDLQANSQKEFIPSKMTRRRYAWGLIAAIGVAAYMGFALLDRITIQDDAQIIAHRGASAAAPENTLAAIRGAIKQNTDWIEIDVQETADGEVVVIHDSDLMKLSGVNLRVWEANAAQLADVDVGGWFAPEFTAERVPTLAQVLAEVKGRSKLIIELKYYGHDQQLEQRVIDLIEAADMQNDTMIMSLEYSGLQKLRALRPDWKIGLLSARAIGDLTRLDVDFLAVNLALARPTLVRAAHAADKELFVWTVNDALSMSQMMSIGVDGVITDEPHRGREVLTARAELSTAQRLLLYVAPLLGVDAPSLNIESNDAAADDSNINLELSLQQRFQDQLNLPGNVLAEFTTDGCSGGLSVGWDYFAEQAGFFRTRHGDRPPWESCCVEHDRAYHLGGGAGLTPTQGFAARLQADDELRACVIDTATDRTDQLRDEYGVDDNHVEALYASIADSMHMAVRLGGMPCTGLSWRWGYGWPNCE